MVIEEPPQITVQQRSHSQKSRQFTKQLQHFATTLDQLDLTTEEHDVVVAERFLQAAELVLHRGQILHAQKFYTRAYSLACKHDRADIALRAAAMRVTLEHIQRNAPAIRFWDERRIFQQQRLLKTEVCRKRERELYNQNVLAIREETSLQVFSPYICSEYKYLLLPYHLCSRGLYDAAMNAVNKPAITKSKSTFLQDETRWLRYRLYLSTQQYSQAARLVDDMKATPPVTARLQECSIIAAGYSNLMDILRVPSQEHRQWFMRIGTFSNSFQALVSEQTGLYLSVFVYELVRYIMENDHTAAEKRLSALRVRVQRSEYNGPLFELRSFLRVIGYIQSTCHRYKRIFPTKLFQELLECRQQTKYAQQGIIPYSELAYRLLKYLNYN